MVPGGPVTVRVDPANGARVYDQDGCCQSEADGRGISHAPYVHAMFGLARQMPALDWLMIGCGGGTLATMLCRAGRRVAAVDVNPEAIRVARRHFAMDPAVACFVADGLDWLAGTRRTFGGIAVDAFAGHRIPDHLLSPRFFAALAGHLAPGGAVLMNVYEATAQCRLADGVAIGLRAAGLPVRMLEQDDASGRNVVVLGGAVQGLVKPALLMPPAGADASLARDLDRMRFTAVPPAAPA